MILIAAAAALSLALNPPARHKKRTSHAPARKIARRATPQTALLALRSALLHDFLVRAGTEAPAFRDARVVLDRSGMRIGPTTVDVDFLGSPIVRAVVSNGSSHPLDVLLGANVRDPHGRSAHASIWIEHLEPGASRTAELYCPDALAPVSVEWTVMPL